MEILNSSITIIASLISIIVGVLTIIIIRRRKQLTIPKMSFKVGPFPVESIPKKIRYRKSIIKSVFFVNEFRSSKTRICTVPLAIENKGSEVIRNIRLQVEFDKEFLVDNETVKSIYQFKPIVRHSKDEADKLIIIKPSVSPKEIENALETREVQIFGERAIVSTEIPLLRP